VFHLKLFLSEVHLPVGRADGARAPVPAPRVRRAYAGERRRVLVVDNEEADRELLVSLLTPLGFEVRQASSGHDCLDLLAAGYRPHAILMDLAMPGIDGWETLRRVRPLLSDSAAEAQVALAIVSANAFDKGLDNDVGIQTDDFILKPVRHSELLDWLERRLELVWTEPAAPPQPVVVDGNTAGARVYPSAAARDHLQQAVQLGYFRGIMSALDAIQAEQPQCAVFVSEVRDLARQFQFEAIATILQQAPREPQPN
jgi:CheY-like chemotaxis protein